MQQTANILKKIIEIPSYVDEDHNEAELAQWIIQFFKKHTSYHIVEQQVSSTRKNIIVSLKNNPKVALFGHMDTVLPKQESNYPFRARVSKEKIYGLGAVDMKAGLAIMLALAKKYPKCSELGFVFTVDEEYEFLGALKLKEIKDFRPTYVINLEPTDNTILLGCRGITEFSFSVHGIAAHSGRKSSGINAIEKSVQLIQEFQKVLSALDKTGFAKSTVNLAYLHGGTLQELKEGSPQISGLGMVVPNYAELNCEIRIGNPKISTAFIKKILHLLASQLGVSISHFSFKFHLGMMLPPKKEPLAFEQAITDSGEHVVYGDINNAGYYELQMLQKVWDSICIIYGPGPIDLSHKIDEYVDMKSMETTEKVIETFIKNQIGNMHA